MNILNFPRYALVLSFLAGSLSALAMAPVNLWAVLFITLPVFYLLLARAPTARAAFATGWCFAFGYFAFGLYWIGNALLVEGNPYIWVWPLASIGLPLFLSLFWGTAALLIYKFINLRSLTGWLGFCGTFTAVEFLRGTILTGFPWNLLGYSWADLLPLLQILRHIDIYTLSLLTMLWASSPALYFLLPKKQALTALALCAASFGLIFGTGLSVLTHEGQNEQIHENIEIKIVQPNIDQAEKWQREKMSEHFDRHVALSRNTQNSAKTTYIVWPETAFTYRYANDPDAMREITKALKTYPGQAYLFSGLLRYDPVQKTYANSLVMIDKAGAIINIYDKHHLVPFGEYIPLAQWIPLRPIVQFNGFQAGAGPQIFSTPDNLKYSPQICYEIIFPYADLWRKGEQPDFILNVTNDAWYGISPGPYQHFDKAKFRALENGVPVIRSANTGFSGLIDGTGHVRGQSSLFTEESLTLNLPKHDITVSPPTTKLALFFTALFLCFMPCILKKIRAKAS